MSIFTAPLCHPQKKLMKYLLITLLLIISPFSHAQFYKWSDKDGHVHYSHSPHNQQTQEVKVRTSSVDYAAQARLKKLSNDLNERRADRRQSREEDIKAVEQRKKVEAFCKKAKSQVTLLKSGASISARAADGTRVNVSDADRTVRLTKLNSHVTRFCHS